MAAYQKIDFHTHLESGRQAEELLLSMQQTDVTLSVILPVVTSPEQFQRGNKQDLSRKTAFFWQYPSVITAV